MRSVTAQFVRSRAVCSIAQPVLQVSTWTRRKSALPVRPTAITVRCQGACSTAQTAQTATFMIMWPISAYHAGPAVASAFMPTRLLSTVPTARTGTVQCSMRTQTLPLAHHAHTPAFSAPTTVCAANARQAFSSTTSSPPTFKSVNATSVTSRTASAAPTRTTAHNAKTVIMSSYFLGLVPTAAAHAPPNAVSVSSSTSHKMPFPSASSANRATLCRKATATSVSWRTVWPVTRSMWVFASNVYSDTRTIMILDSVRLVIFRTALSATTPQLVIAKHVSNAKAAIILFSILKTPPPLFMTVHHAHPNVFNASIKHIVSSVHRVFWPFFSRTTLSHARRVQPNVWLATRMGVSSVLKATIRPFRQIYFPIKPQISRVCYAVSISQDVWVVLMECFASSARRMGTQ